jgi:hypothetical protein
VGAEFADILLAQADSEQEAEATLAETWAALIECQPCVIHDFDDEPAMMKFADALWPGAKEH